MAKKIFPNFALSLCAVRYFHWKIINSNVNTVIRAYLFAWTIYICFLGLLAIVCSTFVQKLCIKNFLQLNFWIEILSTNRATFYEGLHHKENHTGEGPSNNGGGRGGPSNENGPNIRPLFNHKGINLDIVPDQVIPRVTDLKPICGPVSGF